MKQCLISPSVVDVQVFVIVYLLKRRELESLTWICSLLTCFWTKLRPAPPRPLSTLPSANHWSCHRLGGWIDLNFTMSLCISCFSHSCDKLPDRTGSNLRKKWSSVAHSCMEHQARKPPRLQELGTLLATLHPQPGNQEPRIGFQCLSGFLLFIQFRPCPIECAATFRMGLPTSSWANLDHTSRACLKACLLGDSRACQVDNIHHHTPSLRRLMYLMTKLTFE